MLLKECWFCRVSEEARQSAWDNIVTCHHGDKQARTWSFQRKCIGAHHLKSHAADNKAGPVMVCRLPVFCYRNNKMIRLQHFSITCGLLNSKVDHQMCFLLLSIQSSPGPPSVQLLPSNCLVVWTVHNDLITAQLSSSRKLGGAAKYLIDSSEKCICRLSFECLNPHVI